MKVLKFSFLGILIAFVLGLLSNYYIGLNQALLLFIGTVCSLLLLVCTKPLHFFKHYGLSFLFYAIAGVSFFSLGIITYSIQESRGFQRSAITPFMDEEKHRLAIVFSEELKSNAYSHRFYATVETIDNQSVKGKLLVQLPLSVEKPKLGTQWVSLARVDQITPPRFLGEFDYAAYLNNQGVYGQLKLSGNESFTVGQKENWRYQMEAIREGMMKRFASAFQSDGASQLGLSLLFGDRRGLDADVLENFKSTGVLHVLAISGLHVGILFMLLAFVFKFLPRVPRELLIVICLWGFAFLSGMSTSVFRAVLMFSLVCIARLLRREHFAINTVAFAMLVSLCYHPNWIYDVGFQLSYAAVFSILFFYPMLKNYTSSKWWILRYTKELVAVSLAAQLGVFPLLLFYFHQFSWYFLLGNLIAIPLVTLLLISGFIISFFSLVSLDVAKGIAPVFEGLSQLLYYGVEKLNEIPHNVSNQVVFHYSLLFSIGFLVYAIGRSLKHFSSIRILGVLTAILIVQGNIMLVDYQKEQEESLVVTSDANGFVLFAKVKDKAVVYAEQLDPKQFERKLADYRREVWLDEVEVKELPIGFTYGTKQVLVANRPEAAYVKTPQDVVLITGKTKVNYGRLLENTQPKLVLLGSHVPHWTRNAIRATCIKKGIPFHDISEKGFYKM